MAIKYGVFGAGYVGLSTACLLAINNKVKIFEIDSDKIAKINNQRSPIKDSEIENFLTKENVNIKALKFDERYVDETDIWVLALPTNFNDSTNSFETSALEELVNQLSALDPSKPIVIRSTLPIGFLDYIENKYAFAKCAYCPEFLREGRALEDCLNPSRIVIGSSDKFVANDFADALESSSNKLSVPKIITTSRSAEAIKLFSNAYLAMRVSFFNEIDTLSMLSSFKVDDVIKGLSEDPRIQFGYNNPSFAYGGYCLPKDVLQLISSTSEYNDHFPMINAIHLSNEERVRFIIKRIIETKASNIGIYRMQMKKNSDNAREAANLKVYMGLKEKGLSVKVYEPEVLSEIWQQDLENDILRFKKNADLIVANRKDTLLSDVQEKLFTRDIYNEN